MYLYVVQTILQAYLAGFVKQTRSTASQKEVPVVADAAFGEPAWMLHPMEENREN